MISIPLIPSSCSTNCLWICICGFSTYSVRRIYIYIYIYLKCFYLYSSECVHEKWHSMEYNLWNYLQQNKTFVYKWDINEWRYLNTIDGSTIPMKIRGPLFSDLPGWDSWVIDQLLAVSGTVVVPPPQRWVSSPSLDVQVNANSPPSKTPSAGMKSYKKKRK